MAKEGAIEVDGKVQEALPNAMLLVLRLAIFHKERFDPGLTGKLLLFDFLELGSFRGREKRFSLHLVQNLFKRDMDQRQGGVFLEQLVQDLSQAVGFLGVSRLKGQADDGLVAGDGFQQDGIVLGAKRVARGGEAHPGHGHDLARPDGLDFFPMTGMNREAKRCKPLSVMP